MKAKLPSVEDIISIVAEQFDMPEEVICKASQFRTEHAVHARRLVHYVARKTTYKSCREIGESMGGQDHATVLHGYNKISLVANVAPTKAQIEQVMFALQTKKPARA